MRRTGVRKQALEQHSMHIFRLGRQESGFSLIELIIVMAIMGILLSIVTINFNDWQKKAQIERQTRELQADLNSARTESVFRKTRHRITFQPNNYAFKRYSSENEADSAGTTITSRNVTYQMTRESGSSIDGASIEFDMRGLTSNNLTLNLNPVGTGAIFDCIVIHVARTNMGKMENGTCTFK